MECQWNEYDKLSSRVMTLKRQIRKAMRSDEEDGDYEVNQMKQHLSNLSVRVRAVEIELEIEEDDSIVREFLSCDSGD